ncbi:MAG TPA: Holliday junction resolvase RuvX [Bacteroidota bacterium]|nr:Holliday junction resolvase RuvX [Bacteroidota bacterium]
MTTQQTRLLGIDYGTKRIGLSLSDPLRITAQPFETVANDSKLWNRLREIIHQQEVEFVVVGMPLNLKGEQAMKAREVESFIQRLKLEIGCKVVAWDERFTSSIAQESMLRMGTKKKDRRQKGRIDSMAAAIMLQGFLDSTKVSLSC